MDDRRFDVLVKSFAGGASRRSVLKGLLGLGGATVIGGAKLTGDADAARRPTPTPQPPQCPGRQVWSNGACACPSGLSKCGPDCCDDHISISSPSYSECCDNACCNGHCYGEELCCPWQGWCDSIGECCQGNTPKCCPGDACIPSGGCCTDAECPGCQSCVDHVCVDDRANCPGGATGCDDCIEAACEANNSRCDDGNECRDDFCDANTGQCSHQFNCHGNDACCEDDDACTIQACLGDGSCSYQFQCTSDDCCVGASAGPVCDTKTGMCYTPCVAEGDGCSSDSDCCEGSCWGVGDQSVCFICLPNGIPCGFPPLPNICDHCCSNTNAAGFCI